MTKQRAILIDIFRSEECRGQHKTADELWELAKARMPSISRATVYNNLKTMEEEGLICRIRSDNGADVYDSSGIPHGHLVCRRCGMICDLQLPHLMEELSSAAGVELESYELKMRYLCPDCCSAT
jgi:Fur family peroxide stress response transcriptional regulator